MAWGSSTKLGPDGVRYRPSRLIGRGPETVLPYRADVRWRVNGGRLELCKADKQVLSLECREPNFYPGLLLLTRLATPGLTPVSACVPLVLWFSA